MAEARFPSVAIPSVATSGEDELRGRACDRRGLRACDRRELLVCSLCWYRVSALSARVGEFSEETSLARSALFPFPKFRSLADSRSRSNGPPRNPFTYMSVIAKTSSSTAASSKTL